MEGGTILAHPRRIQGPKSPGDVGLIYKYNFTFLLFCTMYKLRNDKNYLNFKENFYFLRPFLTFSFQLPSHPKFEDW